MPKQGRCRTSPPDRESGAETTENAYGLREYALASEHGPLVELRDNFPGPVELRLGDPDQTEPCMLVHGSRCPQLGAEVIVLQPSLVAEDPSRGWAAIGGRFPEQVLLGRDTTAQFRFGPDVADEQCVVSVGIDLEDQRPLVSVLAVGGDTTLVMAADNLYRDIEESDRGEPRP